MAVISKNAVQFRWHKSTKSISLASGRSAHSGQTYVSSTQKSQQKQTPSKHKRGRSPTQTKATEVAAQRFGLRKFSRVWHIAGERTLSSVRQTALRPNLHFIGRLLEEQQALFSQDRSDICVQCFEFCFVPSKLNCPLKRWAA